MSGLGAPFIGSHGMSSYRKPDDPGGGPTEFPALEKGIAGNAWNATAVSLESIPANTPGVIEWILPENLEFYNCGVINDTARNAFAAGSNASFYQQIHMSYLVNKSTNLTRLYVNGGNRGDFNQADGDVLTWTREASGLIVFRINGTIKTTFGVQANTQEALYASICFFAENQTVGPAKIDNAGGTWDPVYTKNVIEV